jgi:FKBP-type peptidyl-prolyl cis-trans isomerase FklB
MTYILMLFLGVLLMVAPVSAKEPVVLKTQKDKVNYAIGVNMINNIRQQGIDIDLNLVIKGMKDAYRDGKLLLTDEELRIGIDQYQTAVRQKRSKMMSKPTEVGGAGEAPSAPTKQ